MRGLLQQLQSQLRAINDGGLDNLHQSSLKGVNNAAAGFDNLVDHLKSLPGEGVDRAAGIQALNEQFEDRLDKLALPLTVALVASMIEEPSVPKLRSELAQQMERTEAAGAEFEKLRQGADKVLAEVGMAPAADYFEKTLGEHTTAAKQWLRCTVGLTVLAALITVGVACAAHKWPAKDVAGTIQRTVPVVILLSVVTGAAVFASRGYAAHKHNETLNRHRHNALGTFQAFYRMMQTAKCDERYSYKLQAAPSSLGILGSTR